MFTPQLQQLEDKLEKLRQAELPKRPYAGWIKTLRQNLGLTSSQLAKKLQLNQSRVSRIERDELRDAVTLKTLNEVAEALNCEFYYAFIPREPLKQQLYKQAYHVAAKKVSYVAHSMALEQQATDQDYQQQQIEELAQKLLAGNLKHLWNEAEE